MEAGDHTAPNPDQTQTERQRLTVAEAAEYLGITAEAVRTRIKRGKLESVKEPPDPGGTVYVLLEADQIGPNADPAVKGQDRTTDQTGIVEELRDRVAYLERQVEEEREARRRADIILAQLSAANAEQARTIRAIEAPSRETDREGAEASPESPEPRPSEATPPEAAPEAQEAAERHSWWRRMFK